MIYQDKIFSLITNEDDGDDGDEEIEQIEGDDDDDDLGKDLYEEE